MAHLIQEGQIESDSADVPSPVPNDKRSDNGGLEIHLLLIKSAPVMIVHNIDVDSGLVNGTLCCVGRVLWWNHDTMDYVETIPRGYMAGSSIQQTAKIANVSTFRIFRKI